MNKPEAIACCVIFMLSQSTGGKLSVKDFKKYARKCFEKLHGQALVSNMQLKKNEEQKVRGLGVQMKAPRLIFSVAAVVTRQKFVLFYAMKLK